MKVKSYFIILNPICCLSVRITYYLQYVTKILKLEKEAPIYISCLQIDCFINTNEESLFVFSSGRALFWVNSAVQAFLSTAKPTWLAKPSREFVVGV